MTTNIRFAAAIAALCASSVIAPPQARACGGFFCSRQPVDQQAERIVFALGPEQTDMIVQISYTGSAPDFAWVLPLVRVPDPSSLDTFPADALVALDANTSPFFFRPDDPECGGLALNGGGGPESTPGVTVHIARTVGPYDVVVIEGSDPMLLVEWLRAEGYRVTDPMVPLIDTYTRFGLSLLALKLNPNADTSDIAPFRLGMPPGDPMIPLMLTAVAAEPEMGILVFVLGDQRWGPGNWPEVSIDTTRIQYASHGWPAETNYLSLLSEAVDDAGGRGWVTEMAGPTAPLAELVRTGPVRTEDQIEARDALLPLLEDHAYITRLYTRLSPDEMTEDPTFAPHPGPDVDRVVQLERVVDGEDMCGGGGASGCDFSLCGQGACREVQAEFGYFGGLAGCECPAGFTARTIRYTGTQWFVPTCVDPSATFLEPQIPGAAGDPCLGFDCGQGSCAAVNMRPTCHCWPGRVAVAWNPGYERDLSALRCVDPETPIPREVWERTLPPPGPAPDPTVEVGPVDGPRELTPGGGGCAVAAVDAHPGGSWALAWALPIVSRIRRRRRRAGER